MMKVLNNYIDIREMATIMNNHIAISIYPHNVPEHSLPVSNKVFF